MNLAIVHLPLVLGLKLGFKYDAIFDGLHKGCSQLSAVLMPFGFVLVVIGTILAFQAAGTPINKIANVVFLVTLVGAMSIWHNNDDSGILRIGADIVHNNLMGNNGLDAPSNGTVVGRLFILMSLESLAGSSNQNPFIQAVFSGMYLVGMGAAIVLWAASMMQKAMLDVSMGVGPLLFGMLAVPQLRATGWNFIQSTFAVLLWPVGWGIVNFGAIGLLNNAMAIVAPSSVDALGGLLAGGADSATPTNMTIQDASRLVWTGVVASYVIGSITAVPFFISQLVGGAFQGLGASLPLGSALGGAFTAGGHGGGGGSANTGGLGAQAAAASAASPGASSGNITSGSSGPGATGSSAGSRTTQTGGSALGGATPLGQGTSSSSAGGGGTSSSSTGSPVAPGNGTSSPGVSLPSSAASSSATGGGANGSASSGGSAGLASVLPRPMSPGNPLNPLGSSPGSGGGAGLFPAYAVANGQS